MGNEEEFVEEEEGREENEKEETEKLSSRDALLGPGHPRTSGFP